MNTENQCNCVGCTILRSLNIKPVDPNSMIDFNALIKRCDTVISELQRRALKIPIEDFQAIMQQINYAKIVAQQCINENIELTVKQFDIYVGQYIATDKLPEIKEKKKINITPYKEVNSKPDVVKEEFKIPDYSAFHVTANTTAWEIYLFNPGAEVYRTRILIGIAQNDPKFKFVFERTIKDLWHEINEAVVRIVRVTEFENNGMYSYEYTGSSNDGNVLGKLMVSQFKQQ